MEKKRGDLVDFALSGLPVGQRKLESGWAGAGGGRRRRAAPSWICEAGFASVLLFLLFYDFSSARERAGSCAESPTLLCCAVAIDY